LLLSDGDLAHGAEPWRVVAPDALPPVESPTVPQGKPFRPFGRDDKLARPWALPGEPGREHCLGGLEKEDGSGVVSYEPDDHEHMVAVRERKVAGIASDIPELAVDGPETGELLVVGWGGTFGALRTAVWRARERGLSVAHAHFRYL